MGPLQWTVFATLIVGNLAVGALNQVPSGWNVGPSPTPGFIDPLAANNNNLFNGGMDFDGFSDRFGQGFVQGGVQGTNIILSPAQSPMGPISSVPSASNPHFFPTNPLTIQGQRVLPPNFLPGPIAPLGPSVPFGSHSIGVAFPGRIFNGPASNFPARGGPLGGVFSSGNTHIRSLHPKKPLNMLVKPKQMIKLPAVPLKY